MARAPAQATTAEKSYPFDMSLSSTVRPRENQTAWSASSTKVGEENSSHTSWRIWPQYSRRPRLWNPANFSLRGPCSNNQRSPDSDTASDTTQQNDSYDKAHTMTAEVDAGRTLPRDLERGPDVMDHRMSHVSVGDGIGSAISSSNSSIMGEDVQADMGDEWGPQHPCYPHMNPHVPANSMEYATTRIIRVRRDWLLHGDLAPSFSNLYPEILDPAGISEPEFRRVIEKLNSELSDIFNPYGARNIVDTIMGAATGWLWDDFGFASSKSRLDSLEKWIKTWNAEIEKTIAPEEGILAPQIIPLRQTGYMTVRLLFFFEPLSVTFH